jgi:hypothetical protein
MLSDALVTGMPIDPESVVLGPLTAAASGAQKYNVRRFRQGRPDGVRPANLTLLTPNVNRDPRPAFAVPSRPLTSRTKTMSRGPFQPGDQCNQYRIVQPLGKGGFGCVYEAVREFQIMAKGVMQQFGPPVSTAIDETRSPAASPSGRKPSAPQKKQVSPLHGIHVPRWDTLANAPDRMPGDEGQP